MARLARAAASNPSFEHIVLESIPEDLNGIDAWLRRYFRYRDEREEVVRTPEMMMETWQQYGYFDGDCDDVSTLTAAILRVYGYPAWLVAIRYDRDPEFKHVFVETGNGLNITRLDASVPEGTQHVQIERMVQFV